MTSAAARPSSPATASPSDFVARGKVIGIKEGVVIFSPAGLNYELHFTPLTPYTGPLDQYIEARLRVKARKVYTVPSGGNFVSPLFGPPRTMQGRVLFADEKTVVIRAGAPIAVELPDAADSIDLSEGLIRVGAIVNAVGLPGATFELVSPFPARV